ncbi:MAG: YXWGXW repeat-containing protein [Betaproteobacteria bacterium]
MWTRKLVLSAMVAGTIGAVAPAAQALDVFINTPPPAVRFEAVPAPRAGYVWAPGYWDYRGHKHVWNKGHWERQRVGYYYHTPTWAERDGRWVMNRGGWDKNRPMGDRDRDGLPNAVDRDRDGDGVRNNADRAPDNPRRH